MAILRHHHEASYTVIPNNIFTDQGLSLKDIGLLCFILHLPDGWNFSVNGLASVLPHDGKDGITASLKRIEQAGYLKRDRERDSFGRLAEAVWIVSDTPMTENPAQENTTQIKKEIKKVRSKGFPSENERVYKGFAAAVKREYDAITAEQEYPYSLVDVLAVFDLYFSAYEQHRGERHPSLKRKQIRDAILALPYSDDVRNGPASLDPEDYPYLIEAYFKSNFKNCDYRLPHFLSGNIRQLKYYETCY